MCKLYGLEKEEGRIMKRCNICMLPEDKFNVTLNEHGVCNYCTHYDQNEEHIKSLKDREAILVNRFDKLKGKYSYDALVGLSGGKDSTYVLYQMVKKYKLKVLALTYDNGFLTDYAKESIKHTVEELGVEHVFYKPDWELHKKFYKAAIKTLGDPCMACAFGGYFLGIKICHEKRIPLFIHGRSPFQMYRNFYEGSKDIFFPMMDLNLGEHSFEKISQVYNTIHSKIRNVVKSLFDDIEDAEKVLNEFFVEEGVLSSEFSPEFLAYFLYEQYDEEKMKTIISEAITWQRPKGDNLLGHYDCAIHYAAGFMFHELNEVDVLEPDIAVMLRFGVITKEKAIELMNANKLKSDNVNESMKRLCNSCNFEIGELNSCIGILKQKGLGKFESR